MSPSLSRPRKRFGQHFLVDQNIVRKIIDLAAVQKDEPVLEIGPGRGILTRALCQQARQVVAVEIDRGLFAHLQSSLADCGNLDLRLGDALDFPYEVLPKGTVVVANLPYYVSTPILFKLLEAQGLVSRLVLMLQTEVASRLVAQPCTRDYGVLSVLAQCWTVPTMCFTVAPTCFRPKPGVGSAVVSLLMRPEPLIQAERQREFARAVRAAFAHRRKTVANSLRDEGFARSRVDEALTRAGIAPVRRAETLTLEDFAHLTDSLAGEGGLES